VKLRVGSVRRFPPSFETILCDFEELIMEFHPAQPQPTAPPTAPPPASAPGQIVYIQPAAHPVRRWFSWLGWIAFFMALSVILGMSVRYSEYFDDTGGVQEKFHSGSRLASDKIAVISVKGVIGRNNSFVKRQVDRVRDDNSVKAVVLRIESPGGTITGSDFIYHHLLELRKSRAIPLVVSMGSIATSGGYYVAMAVGDEPRTIFAEPTTTTGSIGVIIPHYDLSGFLARYDIKDDSLVSHPRKQLLSMTRPLMDGDRGVLEAYLQDAFMRFKDVVKAGRPAYREDQAKLDALATGEIFTANQAKENGLVDELGFVEDAIRRAAELANLPADGYRAVEFKSTMSLLDIMGAAQSRTQDPGSWQALLELSAPQAYYLTTSLPVLAGLATAEE
jgi:protease-4